LLGKEHLLLGKEDDRGLDEYARCRVRVG
jgi:hypothetical protein